MSDDGTPTHASVDRRSFLVAGGVSLAGLGLGASRGSSRAQVSDVRPVAGSDGDSGDGPGSASQDYEAQQVVSDESGAIQFAVPTAWDDVSGSPMNGDPFLVASSDAGGYATSWDVPGIEVSVRQVSATSPGGELDELTEYGGACADGGRQQTRLPDYEFISQGWFQCSSEGSTFLSMAGVPASDTGTDGANGRDGNPDELADGSANAAHVVVVGAQGVTEQDMGAIAAATHSLVTHPPDAGDDPAGHRTANPPRQRMDIQPEPSESIEGEIQPGSAGHCYTFDGITAGDRIRVEATRTGGQGQQGVYLLEPDAGIGFPSAIDAAMVTPYGSNGLTGRAGPFTLSGTATVSGPGHAVAILPGPYPEGTGPYELTIEHEERER